MAIIYVRAVTAHSPFGLRATRRSQGKVGYSGCQLICMVYDSISNEGVTTMCLSVAGLPTYNPGK